MKSIRLYCLIDDTTHTINIGRTGRGSATVANGYGEGGRRIITPIITIEDLVRYIEIYYPNATHWQFEILED